MRVVIVDDHPLVRRAVRDVISDVDVEVVAECGTAEEALETVRTLRPDVMLLDINLPGMGGLELIGEVRNQVPAMKIIMLTVEHDQREVDEAILRGASGYLTKDLPPGALRRAVRGLAEGQLAMSRRHAAEALARFADAVARATDFRDGPRAQLTKREREVLRLLAQGLTNREIAAALLLSHRTIERHVGGILHKLELPNRAAAARAYRDGAGSPL